MTEKLDNKHATKDIKQTRKPREVIPFRDSAIEKINQMNIEFGSKRFKDFRFDGSKYIFKSSKRPRENHDNDHLVIPGA